MGQRVEERSTLTIQHGGVPRADIINAVVEYYTDEDLRGDFTSLTIPLGGTLYFTATVENYGDTPVRTTGPESGTTYTSRQLQHAGVAPIGRGLALWDRFRGEPRLSLSLPLVIGLARRAGGGG